MEAEYYNKDIVSELVNCFRIHKGITILVMTDRNIAVDSGFGVLSEIKVDEEFLD